METEVRRMPMNAENIVNWPRPSTQGIEHGTVRGGGDEGFMVHGTSGVFVATEAFSCLVKPQAGDKIMYTRDPEGGCYILAILERPTGSDALLSFPGDVTVQSKKGNVSITAASGIDLATGSTISMRASEVSVSAVNGRLNVLDLQAIGDSFTGTLNRVHLISDAVDVVAQRVTQRLKSCYRWVEEIEHIMAGQMIHKVSNLFSVRARQTAITAKDDVKIDGERVHLG
jgi:hypothetical protein